MPMLNRAISEIVKYEVPTYSRDTGTVKAGETFRFGDLVMLDGLTNTLVPFKEGDSLTGVIGLAYIAKDGDTVTGGNKMLYIARHARLSSTHLSAAYQALDAVSKRLGRINIEGDTGIVID